MSHCIHNSHNPSACQTLDELDFERGIWFAEKLNHCLIGGEHGEHQSRYVYTVNQDIQFLREQYHTLQKTADINNAQHNDMVKVKQWIKKKDINELDGYGYTALHYASRNGHLEMCKLLISNGANVNALTKSGKVSPLHRCVSMGHCDIFMLLLDSGAAIDVRDGDGKTVLHRAVEGGHCHLVEKILEISPSLVKATDKRGFTPKEYLNISPKLLEIFNKYE